MKAGKGGSREKEREREREKGKGMDPDTELESPCLIKGAETFRGRAGPAY